MSGSGQLERVDVVEETTSNSDTDGSWTVLDDDLDRESNGDKVDTVEDTVVDNVMDKTCMEEGVKTDVVDTGESDSDIECIDDQLERMESVEINDDVLGSASSSMSNDDDDYSWLPAMPRIQLMATPYPPEELPHSYASIRKGQTYSHEPNARLNLYLSSLLVLCVCLVVGLGLGHFLGWSERLELQELYADVMEERLEEMEDNLVTCMTGIEGQGGDDQDLDDKIIQRLHIENELLKDELHSLRTNDEQSADDELIAILRDRINDLLVANDRLDKEVLRLKGTQDKSQQQVDSDEPLRAALNELSSENEQLRIALAKARYAKPTLGLEERERLNMVVTENEELRAELRRMRYGVKTHDKHAADWLDNNGQEDEGYVSDRNSEEEKGDGDSSGDDNVKDVINEEDDDTQSPLGKTHLDDFGLVGLLRDSLQPERISSNLERVGEKLQQAVLKLRPKVERVRSKMDRIAAGVSDVIGNAFVDSSRGKDEKTMRKNFYAILEDTVRPLIERGGSMTSSFVTDLKQTLEDTWVELEAWSKSEAVQRRTRKGKRNVEKLIKSIKKSLEKAKKAFKVNVNDASDVLSSLKDDLLQTMSFIRTKVGDEHEQSVERMCMSKNSSDFEVSAKSNDDDDDDDEEDYDLDDYDDYDEVVEEKVLKKHKSWLFDRAQNRERARLEARNSEWLFERAQHRKQMQRFNAADWYERKMMREHHHDDDYGHHHVGRRHRGGEQRGRSIDQDEVAGVRHGHQRRARVERRHHHHR